MTVYPTSNDDRRHALDQAIADARAGRREQAVHRLRQIVGGDPANVDAWIWLGGTAPDAREQRRALERALELAPDDARAQKGLHWLRTTAPHAFDTDKTPATGTPTSAAPPHASHVTTPIATSEPQQQWQRSNATTPAANATMDQIEQRASAPTQAVNRDALVDRSAQPHEQQTQAMPARQPANVAGYQRRSDAAMQQRPAPPLARTEPLRSAPPTYHARPQRSAGANVARWALLIPLWGAGLGAALVLSSLTIYALINNPAFLDTVMAAPLRPFGLGIEPGNEGRIGLLAALIVVVFLDLFVLVGLVLGRVWAWRIAVLVSLITLIGAVALVAIPFIAPGIAFRASFADPVMQTLLGVLGFTFLLFLLTLGSRGAFRRPDEEYEYYGR